MQYDRGACSAQCPESHVQSRSYVACLWGAGNLLNRKMRFASPLDVVRASLGLLAGLRTPGTVMSSGGRPAQERPMDLSPRARFALDRPSVPLP